MGKKTENKSKEFIDQMIDYFSIKDRIVIVDLIMIINSKKYKIIEKNIKYFFDNFSNRKLSLPQNINLLEMNLKTLKITLNQSKRESLLYRVFTSIDEKKETIDFFKSKINSNEI